MSASSKTDMRKIDLAEAKRLAEWLAGVEAEMFLLLYPEHCSAPATLAGMVHRLLEQGNIEDAVAKAAHLPYANRQIPEERQADIQQRLGEVMLANFNSMVAAYIGLHNALGTEPPARS